MKEYVKVDNQIFTLLLLLAFAMWPMMQHKHRVRRQQQEDYLLADCGKFSAADLI